MVSISQRSSVCARSSNRTRVTSGLSPKIGSRLTEFITDEGVLVPPVTTEQMREVDRVAIENQTPNLFQMMENAGRTLAQTAIEHLGAEWRDRPIVVCAGSGGNGGGGICAARHLANHGGDLTLILPVLDGMTPVAEQQLQIFRKTSGRIGAAKSAEAELILDALIGYGLKGAPGGANQDAIQWMAGDDAPVISLDVPSGLDSTTGETPGDAIEATATLTLALPKTGLFSPLAGDLFLADIGIPSQVLAMAGIPLDHPIFEGQHRIHLNRGAV